MADGNRSNTTMDSRNESQNEGQAQAIRLDEAVLSGKGCEPQDNPQRGMGQGDTMKDLLGNAIPKKDAAKKVIGSNIVNPAGNSSGDTYQYSDRSLI